MQITFEEPSVTAGFLVPVSAFPSLGGKTPSSAVLLAHPSVTLGALHSLAHAVIAQQKSIAVRQQELIARAVDALLIAVGVENGHFGKDRESPILTRLRIDAFLASRFSDPALTVESVAEEFRLSRRSLQRAYEGSGTTLWQEVIRLRVAHATALLRDPNSASISIEQIRLISGFTTSAQMRRAFVAATGMTPTAVRALLSTDGQASQS